MNAKPVKVKESSLLKNHRLKFNRKILIQDFLEQRTISRGFPAHLKIELTSYCNLKCKVCPSRIMKRGEGFIDPNLFKSIIDQTQKTEFIYHHFMGESLFHPNVFELINYSKRKGIKTGLSTNATILDNEKAKEMIKSGLDFLVISFDGGSKEAYENIRENANYHQTLINIQNLLSMVKKSKTKLIPVVQVIDYDMDMATIQKLYDTFDCGIMLKIAKDWAGSVDIDSMLKKTNEITCLLPWIEMSILWDGRVVPCANCFDAQNTLGDANKQGLYEIWNSPVMQNFRRIHIDKHLKMVDVCNECPKYQVNLAEFQKFDQCEIRLKTYNNRDFKVRKGLS